MSHGPHSAPKRCWTRQIPAPAAAASVIFACGTDPAFQRAVAGLRCERAFLRVSIRDFFARVRVSSEDAEAPYPFGQGSGYNRWTVLGPAADDRWPVEPGQLRVQVDNIAAMTSTASVDPSNGFQRQAANNPTITLSLYDGDPIESELHRLDRVTIGALAEDDVAAVAGGATQLIGFPPRFSRFVTFFGNNGGQLVVTNRSGTRVASETLANRVSVPVLSEHSVSIQAVDNSITGYLAWSVDRL